MGGTSAGVGGRRCDVTEATLVHTWPPPPHSGHWAWHTGTPATRATKRVMGAGYAGGGAAVLFCVTPAVRSSVLSSFNAVGNVG